MGAEATVCDCHDQWSLLMVAFDGRAAPSLTAILSQTSVTDRCSVCDAVLSNNCELSPQFVIIQPPRWSYQGDHLSGKPGNVREFDGCQGNVRDSTENQGIVREKIVSGKRCLKLFIVNCIFVSIQVFSRSLLCLKC